MPHLAIESAVIDALRLHLRHRSPLKCYVGIVAICFVPLPSIGNDRGAGRLALAIIRCYQIGTAQEFVDALSLLIPPTQTYGLTIGQVSVGGASDRDRNRCCALRSRAA